MKLAFFRRARAKSSLLGEQSLVAEKRCHPLAGQICQWVAALGVALVAHDSVNAQTVDTALNNGLLEPHSIAFGGDTTFYITDSATHVVLKYDSKNGQLTTLAGVKGKGGLVNGPGFLATFLSPRGIVTARDGLLVADSANHSLRYLTLTGGVSVVTTFAGINQPGLVDGPLASARFNTPVGLAVDSMGNIFVADSKNNAVRKIDLSGNVTTVSTDFFEPSGIAIDPSDQVFIADTRNHAIKLLKPDGSVELFAGSADKVAGITDSYFAEEALFNQPSGLVWLGGNTGLLVSDTGNHTLRRIYFDPIVAAFFPELNGYSVETYAGVPRQLGLLDGALATAQFNSPVGMTKDADGGLLVADLGNRALRRIQTTPILPKVSDPEIGQVTFVVDEATGAVVSQLVPFSNAVFNNEVIIGVLAESGTESFYRVGPTPGLFEEDTIPVPNALNSQTAPSYQDGLGPNDVKPSIISPAPDVTIKVVSTAEGRRPSEVVQARVQFKVASPTIVGDNPAAFTATSDTVDATIWYTLDGSAPTNQPPSIEAVTTSLSIVTNAPFEFRARAFRDSFKPSEIVTKTFSPTEFKANRITFGFERGEASSDFVAAAGQRFYAPVTLSLLPKQGMYSLQFNVQVTAINGAPPVVGPNQVGFSSTLMEEIPPDSGIFRVIPPAMLVTSTNPPPPSSMFIRDNIPFQDLLFTNNAINLLGVGWLARAGITNELLFNVIAQDLITFSQPHDTLFLKSEGRVVAGAYSFVVPPTATPGQVYQISLGRASATSDGIGGPNGDIFIDMPTAGSLTNGAINAVKHVTVGQRKYIVGDVAPFRWFNAGDFGNGSKLSDDVMQVFQTVTYGLNAPIPGSDFFDAMDSCCGGVPDPNALFDGSDATINNITSGDTILDVADVFVTFRRSLDPSLTWYQRFWNSGALAVETTPNLFRGKPSLPAEEYSNASLENLEDSSGPPSAFFGAPDLMIAGGQTLSIPLTAQINGPYPARVCLVNVEVEALEGSPPIGEPIVFSPNPNLGQPTLSNSRRHGNYAAAWLSPTTTGLSGDTQLGTLRVKLPDDLPSDGAYRVRFEHVSASPNGLGVLPQNVQDGLLLVSSRNESYFNDGIPDTWRLRFFGATENWLSHAEADADGDGVNNMTEFQAGTNPTDIFSVLRMKANHPRAESAFRGIVLRWPSAKGKTYTIEASSSIQGGEWVPAAANRLGTGMEMEFTAPEDGPTMQFYRVRLVQ